MHSPPMVTSSSTQNIKAATLNIRSIRNKIEIILDLFNDLDLDFLCLTETWLSNNDTPIISSLNTDTHCFVHLPRDGLHLGGGIGLLYNKNIKLTNNKDLKQIYSEALSCTFHPTNSQPITFITIYRPPHQSIPLFIDELNELLITTNKHTIILGDFNIPISPSSHYSKLLNQTINSHNCTQYVTSSTHSSGNILDLIITHNTNTSITNTSVNRLITDHHIITFIVKSPKPKRQSQTIHYRKSNNINITDYMRDFTDLLNTSKDPTDTTNLDIVLLKTLDKHAPITTKIITKRNNIKWFNPTLSLYKRKLRSAEKTWRKFRSHDNLISFRQHSSEYRFMIKKAKHDYYTDTIKAAGNDTKKLFQISNSLLGRITPRILPEGTLSSLPALFDIYFKNKVQIIINSLPPLTLPPLKTSIYKLDSFTIPTATIIDKLLQAVKSSCKLDPIPTTLLHKLSTHLTPYYKNIIDRSLISGIVPSSMKHAHVTPIIKNSSLDKSDLSNYRPISNLSYISKTLERVVCSQLSNYLDKHKLLNKFQSAYTKNKSTETALTHILNKIRLYPTQYCSIIILLDLSAAFDTISHNIMIHRLEYIGITGTALAWFSSYLSDRTYSISIESHTTDPRLISHGVPQGSVLAPILFNIYISPLLDIFDNYPDIYFHTYADDLQIYCNLPNPSTNIATLNKCLEDIRLWLSTNSLSLNTHKTQAILINTTKTVPIVPLIQINNHNIKYSPYVKNLGITIDQSLNFTQYTTDLSKSINRTLHTIRLIRPSITTELSKLLATSLILPRLDYCNSILHRLPKNSLIPLNRLPNSTARTVHRIPKYSRTHITPYLKSLHWLPITQRIQYKTLLISHQVIHHNHPDYLTDILIENNTSRIQRKINKYKLLIHNPKHISRKQETAFSISAPKLWNNLPYNIREITSTPLFKRKLKTHLFEIVYK